MIKSLLVLFNIMVLSATVLDRDSQNLSEIKNIINKILKTNPEILNI